MGISSARIPVCRISPVWFWEKISHLAHFLTDLVLFWPIYLRIVPLPLLQATQTQILLQRQLVMNTTLLTLAYFNIYCDWRS